ncbi:MAG: hypothetical protein JOZ92_03225 [Candidatus Dormibacteraeota bacterium]|nr:hypothetical protein [Candidatus Dormibacteraeota bacterium]
MLEPPRDAAALDRSWLIAAVRSGPAGVHLAPRLAVTPELVRSHLLTLFDVTVLDLARSLDPSALLGVADRVVIVTTPMRPALRSARLLLDEVASRGHADRTTCVLNHAEASRDVDTDEVSSLLRSHVSHIPYDPAVVAHAVNQGGAFVESDPASSVARAVSALAARLDLVATAAAAADDTANGNSAGIGRDSSRLDRRLLRFGRR